MKLIVATVAALTATSASAADLAFGLQAGGEAIAEYNVDAEKFLVTLEPTIGYTLAGVDLTASTLLTVYDGDFVLGDTRPTLDFEARKTLWNGLDVYGGVGYDLEAEARTDMTVGLSFNF